MKKTISKMLCLGVSACLVLGSGGTVYAEDVVKEEFEVYSEEFPDAYIITESVANDEKTRTGVSNELKATVFVEETLEVVDDEITVTDSKLLSKDEVEAIGEDEFENIDNSEITKENFNVSRTQTTRGKLTLYMAVLDYARVSAGFEWSGFDVINSGSNNPAVGADYMGTAWSGGYQVADQNAWVWYQNDANAPIYLADAVPNASRVWSFNEYYGGSYKLYTATGALRTYLNKGNAPAGKEVVYKYIHTYESAQGNISISASSSGVGAGFSLSGISKQWSLVLTDKL